jgi:hypothetical protein
MSGGSSPDIPDVEVPLGITPNDVVALPRDASYRAWGQCYKTIYGHKLRIFITS